MAMRLEPIADKSDLADIISLIEVIGGQTPEDVLDFAASFYQEANISARLRLGIRTLWRIKDNAT